MLTACSSAQSSEEEVCALPGDSFDTTEEAVKRIKEVKAGGKDSLSFPGDFPLYDKDHIYVLEECPIPDFEQKSITLILQGTSIYYRNNYDIARFAWYEDCGTTENINSLTERYDLQHYDDTKFFVGKSKQNIYIYWWENGDQFHVRYPSEYNIAPEDVIENIKVQRIDL